MGIFSQDKTATNQTSVNQQVGLSQQTQSGYQITGAGGGITGGQIALGSGARADISYNLDATALSSAASLVNNALQANTDLAHSAIQSFQTATGSSVANGAVPGSESGLSPPSLYTPGTVTGATPIFGALSQHDLILFGIAAVVGGLLIYGYLKHRK